MPFTLYDDPATRLRLLPFTHTRAIADIRCGAFTQRERWEYFLGKDSATLTATHLQSEARNATEETLFVNAAVIATKELADAISALAENKQLNVSGVTIAARISTPVAFESITETIAVCTPKTFDGPVKRLTAVWDIFSFADAVLREDFALLTEGKSSQKVVPSDCSVRGAENFFLDEAAIVGAGTVINAEAGPVFIARGAEVMEGCLLRGPLYIGEGSVTKMGAKIYGGTVIGPGCKVGGEVQNAVFFANSNKGHDGYLGNAVIGEWCNLGADTNCSNLKNDYGPVKIIDEATGRNTATGLTFCGLLMGDHSKCGINTMFNTGTVVGVSCNIWGSGFPEKFFPSFTWGGPQDGYKEYRLDRALDTARRVFARRGKELSEKEATVLSHVFETTAPLRAKQIR